MEKIYIFGHKNPDTDTVVSSIVYSEFLLSTGVSCEAVVLGDANNETKFLLEKFGFALPNKVQTLPAGANVVLVDHNESTQTIDNIKDLNIVGLIDHHKFGGFSTSNPIFCRVEPIGSTASVIAKIMRENGFVPKQNIASLMIGAIISDTLFFRSPTTTDYDKTIVAELNKIAMIADLEAFAMQMFKAKSNLGDISVEDLIKLDYKEFDFNGTKVGIGAIETVDPNYSLSRKEEILKGLADIKTQNNLDLVFLCIIDILQEENFTFVLGDQEVDLLKQIYGKDTDNNICALGNIISRKKQIVPKFTDFFDNK